jgi:hypothetical protein
MIYFFKKPFLESNQSKNTFGEESPSNAQKLVLQAK